MSTPASAKAAPNSAVARRLPLGAEIQPNGGVHFRVWAGSHDRVELVLDDGTTLPMTPESDHHFAVLAPEAHAGTRYQFRLSGSDKLYPDPASRWQPEGVHGPSEVVDHTIFKWTDAGWKGITASGQVLYELHVGTFTREGTWAAATRELAELKNLGITCIEVMPVNEFPGEFGWGYDGVDLFAPTRLYGKPDDFRKFVDTAHSIGLSVILDVVYNHIGPDGNYLLAFSKQFFSETHKNDWGQQLNFDGPGAAGVREFFITNARYWISEFHLDGYRFDATHAIIDDSKTHVLAEISSAAREAAGERTIYLVAENEAQQAKVACPREAGGYGYDAQWNDDFHHSAAVALIGRNEAFYTDYRGKASEFVASAKWGYLYQGQIYAWQKKRRGSPSLDLPTTAFVNYLQNHDQVANFGLGQRIHELSGLPQYRAMSALLLLMPQTPLLFQGQEFASSSTFHFFANHNEELGKAIQKGRVNELSQFPSVASEDVVAAMRDPTSRETFERCKLKFEERTQGYHGRIYRMHKDLLRLRREDPVFNRVHKRGDIDGATLNDFAFILRYFGENNDDRLIVVNLGTDLYLNVVPEPLMAAPVGKMWDTILSTEDPAYGGTGAATLENRGEKWRLPGENWRIPGRCTVVLKPIDGV